MEIMYEDIIIAMAGILVVIGFIVIAMAIAIYVCRGLALYTVGKAEGESRKWLAWIPIGHNYILLKSGEKNINYIWLFIGTSIFTITINIASYFDSMAILFLSLIALGFSIWQIVIMIQCYLVIAKKYQMSPAWFIVGIFIGIVMIPAYIILYNKASKICKGQQELK